MFPQSSFWIAILAATAGAHQLGTPKSGFLCDAPDPAGELLAMHHKLATDSSFLRNDHVSESINVDTYVHIIADNKTTQGGWLEDDTIQKQMEVLNEGFAPSGISFSLKQTDRTVMHVSWNSTIFNETAQLDFKKRLRQGDYRSLNLYYLPSYASGGVCTFPNLKGGFPESSDVLFLDGCMIGSRSTPDNPGPNGMGKTTIHEVGHWFGLLHTFWGGCNETAGDYIHDTPAEKTDAGSGCPVGRDTCPDLPGLDPVHNYMDYSSEVYAWPDCSHEDVMEGSTINVAT